MPRGPRYLPPGWSVEVTTRTICGFYLLPATSSFARVMVGILGKAQEKYPVQIHAAVAASNHYHLILTPADAEQLADFMEYVNGNLARISDWKGLHCAEALIDGKPMSGMWYDRAIEYETNRQAERKEARTGIPVERIERGAFMTPYELKLAPLPCWRNMPRAQIRKRVAEMVAEIEAKAARLREQLGSEIVGMERSATRIRFSVPPTARVRRSRCAMLPARPCASDSAWCTAPSSQCSRKPRSSSSLATSRRRSSRKAAFPQAFLSLEPVRSSIR